MSLQKTGIYWESCLGNWNTLTILTVTVAWKGLYWKAWSLEKVEINQHVWLKAWKWACLANFNNKSLIYRSPFIIMHKILCRMLLTTWSDRKTLALLSGLLSDEFHAFSRTCLFSCLQSHMPIFTLSITWIIINWRYENGHVLFKVWNLSDRNPGKRARVFLAVMLQAVFCKGFYAWWW